MCSNEKINKKRMREGVYPKYNIGQNVEKDIFITLVIIMKVGQINFIQDLRLIQIKWVWQLSSIGQ